MPKMIQIRNVPDDLHRRLELQAAAHGMTLSDYLLAVIEEVAEKPTLNELMDRLAAEQPASVAEPPEVTIRRLRDTE